MDGDGRGLIAFSLKCRDCGHGFDGWFRSGEDFERQTGAGLLECPACGGVGIVKALMKPAIGKARGAAPAGAPPSGDGAQGGSGVGPASGEGTGQPGSGPSGPPYANAEAAKAFAALQAIARKMRSQADYVGPRFAEEARRIHYGETESRGIWGEANRQDVESLTEEGIVALPMPTLPEDRN